MQPIMNLDPARACAAVYLSTTPTVRRAFRENTRRKYNVEAESGAELLAVLFDVARKPGTLVRHDVDRLLRKLHTESTSTCILQRFEEQHVQIDAAASDTLTNAALVVLAAAEVLTHSPEKLMEDLVVASAIVLANNPPGADGVGDLDQHAAEAARAFVTTDVPDGETTDPTPANDAQGALDGDLAVLVHRDGKRLLELLHQAETEAHAAVFRYGLEREDTMRTDRAAELRMLEEGAKGEARALRRARALLLGAVPALLGDDAAMPSPEELAAPTPLRVRQGRVEGQPRPREFAWGTPSVNGFRPSIIRGQDAIELHFTIPEARGTHPAYASAGQEIADRVGATIARLIDQQPAATCAMVRVDLFRAARGMQDQPTRAGWSGPGPAPLAAETTGAGVSVVICPWCGVEQAASTPAEDPALFAGDPVEETCESCQGRFELRLQDKAALFARALPRATCSSRTFAARSCGR